MTIGSHELQTDQANLDPKTLHEDVERHLRRLTVSISDRSVGSAGNKDACEYVHDTLWNLGWQVTEHDFDALDWEYGAASITMDDG